VEPLDLWLSSVTMPVVALVVIGGMLACALIGMILRGNRQDIDADQEGHVVSGVVGLI
jgi:hypothetical protein